MTNIFIFLFAIIFSSCSAIKPLHSNQDQLAQVDLGEYGSNPGKNSQNTVITPPTDTIRIGENGGDVYTQNETEMNSSSEDQAKRLRISLSFGPGLYRTLNYVSVLKVLEKHNLAPKIVTGTEFGAVVAAMYATGMTPEIIEWNFYKYFKEKRNYRPYSSEWIEEIDTFLLEKFKNKNIEDSSRKFFITLFNFKNKKTYYFDKGNIRNLLLLNFKLSNTNQNARKNVYSTAMESEVFNPRLIKKVGSDFSIGVDSLGTKFELEDSNEYLIGIYGKISGKIAKEKKGFDFFISLPLSNMSLDSTANVASYMMSSQQVIESQINSLKKTIQIKTSPSANGLE